MSYTCTDFGDYWVKLNNFIKTCFVYNLDILIQYGPYSSSPVLRPLSKHIQILVTTSQNYKQYHVDMIKKANNGWTVRSICTIL